MPLGFDPSAAKEMSKQVTQLAVDLGSFNNMADDAVLRDLHAALTGSGEVMKKYGVLVSEAAVKQELLNQGMDPKVATDQEKVLARLSIIMAGTTAAQGDAIRTSDSFANQMKRLNATLDDTKVAVGEAVLPALTALVGDLVIASEGTREWAEANQESVVLIAKVGAVVLGLGGTLIAFGGIVRGASAAVGVFNTVVGMSSTGLAALGVTLAAVTFAAFIASARAAEASLKRVNDEMARANRDVKMRATLEFANNIDDVAARRRTLQQQLEKFEGEAEFWRKAAQEGV